MEGVLGLKENTRDDSKMFEFNEFTWRKFTSFIIEIVEKKQSDKKIY
jgi:hypothetical protein